MKLSAITLFVLLLCSVCSNAEHHMVRINEIGIETGLISGCFGKDTSVKVFKGIPYAAPPIGELRWMPPVKAKTWQGVRKCDTFSASAMQSKPAPLAMWSKEFQAPVEPLSEDCLYLNVWTAAHSNREKRPVIVWIHGGAFTGGSGSVPLYNGETMARKGIVFVTINYRVGIFGFLAHPDLSAETAHKISGNYGILDQIAALQWVKRNISVFGGNPDKVTIAGQSAGAFSVNALMISPLAKGLFQRAIAQSGGMMGFDQLRSQGLAEAEKAGVKVTEQLNVKTIKELRMLPADKLMKASGRWMLTTDNVVIPPPYKAYSSGKYNDVPLLTGWNADDGVSLGGPPSPDAFIAEAKLRFGDKSEEYLKLFPAYNEDVTKQSFKLASQLGFGWLNYSWAKLQSEVGKNKAYLYYFTHVPPGLPNYGAFHSAEFGYALGTLAYWDRPFQDVDYKLSEIMTSYWANFATTGNPNADGLPIWPAFDKTAQQMMVLGDTVRSADLPNKKQLEFFDSLIVNKNSHE